MCAVRLRRQHHASWTCGTTRTWRSWALPGTTRPGSALTRWPGCWAFGYPGGAPMDALAQGGRPAASIPSPRVHVDGAPLDMSFSGLKTAVVNLAHNAQQKGETLWTLPGAGRVPSHRPSATMLVPRAMEAARRTGRRHHGGRGGRRGGQQPSSGPIWSGPAGQAGCQAVPARLCGCAVITGP